jgi:hypothetical protein
VENKKFTYLQKYMKTILMFHHTLIDDKTCLHILEAARGGALYIQPLKLSKLKNDFTNLPLRKTHSFYTYLIYPLIKLACSYIIKYKNWRLIIVVINLWMLL